MRERIRSAFAVLAGLTARIRRKHPGALLTVARRLAAAGLLAELCAAGTLLTSSDSTSQAGRRITAGDLCAADPIPCQAEAGAERMGAAAEPAQLPAKARHSPRQRPARPQRTPAARIGFIPYVDASLSPPFSLTTAARQAGVKHFTLAFIESGGGCTPAWGGSSSLGSNPVAAQIGALRKIGGDVQISFGGQSGADLAHACADASELAGAYQKVISAFAISKADFDIEGAALSDTDASRRRARAIARLQAHDPRLHVSFTLPTAPSGLNQQGLHLLAGAKRHGVRISAVNIMAMDYGDGVAPHPAGRMGAYAIDAARSAHAQVERVLGLGSAAAWRKIAVTLMIGVNGVPDEIFTVAQAAQVARFAARAHLAWLSMWSGTRDKECRGGAGSRAHPDCSSIVQAPWAFSKALRP